MDSTKIDRINTLHHKAQSVGLTEEEKKEQAELRKEYIATIKMNLRNQLDNIDVKEADGTVVNLGEMEPSDYRSGAETLRVCEG